MISAKSLQPEYSPQWTGEFMLDLDIREYSEIIKLGLYSGISECDANPKKIVSSFIEGTIYKYEKEMYDDLICMDYIDLEGCDDTYPYCYVDYSSYGGVLDFMAYSSIHSLRYMHLHARNGHSPVEEFEKSPLFAESWYRRMQITEDTGCRVFEVERDRGLYHYRFSEYIMEFMTTVDEMEAPRCSG